MYAFALWDSDERQLILARDPLGIKPLVRTLVDGSLLFASEFKAFRGHESFIPVLDESALVARIAWEYPLDGTTLLEDVTQIRPGTSRYGALTRMAAAFSDGFFKHRTTNSLVTTSWNPGHECCFSARKFC